MHRRLTPVCMCICSMHVCWFAVCVLCNLRTWRGLCSSGRPVGSVMVGGASSRHRTLAFRLPGADGTSAARPNARLVSPPPPSPSPPLAVLSAKTRNCRSEERPNPTSGLGKVSNSGRQTGCLTFRLRAYKIKLTSGYHIS